IVTVLRSLVREELSPEAMQLLPATEDLHRLLLQTIRGAGNARLRSRDLLRALGWTAHATPTANEMWQHLLAVAGPARAGWKPIVDRILAEGCLSQRILQATGPNPGHRRLQSVYARLADCLDQGEMFQA
ncbi:MAG TPA: glutamate--cysteine ligase, partial [Verrucomicrobiae bacterium]|nr:glutamate--cysteine ligase [Verrucomicrobiae bacterium]